MKRIRLKNSGYLILLIVRMRNGFIMEVNAFIMSLMILKLMKVSSGNCKIKLMDRIAINLSVTIEKMKIKKSKFS